MKKTLSIFRLKYDSEASLESMLTAGTLLLPSILPVGEKRDKTALEVFLRKNLKVGDCVLAANFDIDLEMGEVVAMCRVDSIDAEWRVTWKRVTRKLFPNPRGGVPAWKNRAVFDFSRNPRERYELERWFRKEFPEQEDDPQRGLP